VIKALAPDKAPGLDGFMTRFFQAGWDIIRPDIMHALDAFWHINMRSFHSVNEALIILLPKTDGAASVRDNRPIALIHSIGKLFARVLAGR
jgi:hypothetical protein